MLQNLSKVKLRLHFVVILPPLTQILRKIKFEHTRMVKKLTWIGQDWSRLFKAYFHTVRSGSTVSSKLEIHRQTIGSTDINIHVLVSICTTNYRSSRSRWIADREFVIVTVTNWTTYNQNELSYWTSMVMTLGFTFICLSWRCGWWRPGSHSSWSRIVKDKSIEIKSHSTNGWIGRANFVMAIGFCGRWCRWHFHVGTVFTALSSTR